MALPAFADRAHLSRHHPGGIIRMIFSVSISRRRALLSALAGFGAACIMSSTGSAAPDSPAPATAAAKSDPVHDFDAFFGTWHVRHCRLKERLAGNNEWIEFEGCQTM